MLGVGKTTPLFKKDKMENNKIDNTLLIIENHGCNFELEKREINYLASILNYDGFSVVELTKENLKEIKDWIIENEN